MLITLHTTYAGPRGTVQAGRTVTWPDDDEAQQMIRDGYATAVTGQCPIAATPASSGKAAGKRVGARRSGAGGTGRKPIRVVATVGDPIAPDASQTQGGSQDGDDPDPSGQD